MDDVYYMTQTKPKSNILLLKMDSGEVWFANASVNGIPFKFLMDSGASKSVMSSKWFMSILELFRPKLCNSRLKFKVANEEVLNAILVAHASIQMYGYTFKLPIFVCDLGDIDCLFVLDAGKRLVSSHVHKQAESGLMQMSMVNQNSCLGEGVILYAIFEQFGGLNLNNSRPQLSK